MHIILFSKNSFMKRELSKELACPGCKNSKLSLTISKESKDDIEEGALDCDSCGKSYDIIEGIPIMMDGDKNIEQYKIWDDIWKDIELNIRNIIQRTTPDELLNYFSLVKIVRKHGTVRKSLDIGCGSGSFSYVLSRFDGSEEVYMIDVSFESLKLAKRLFSNMNVKYHFILADASSIPFPDNHFDISFSTGLIEHFKYNTQKRIVSEHCRVAGKTIIQVPTNSIPYWLMRTLVTIKNCGWPFGYEKPVSRNRLRNMLRNEGFSVRKEDYHDLLTILLYYIRPRIRIRIKRTLLNLLARHELIFYAER